MADQYQRIQELPEGEQKGLLIKTLATQMQ